ncbi:hypothetical protein GCM10007304_14510 [Rhodococcoides trifolii]|uniref:Uncharacterized protein n=1 Tax=Rhodococcoides trifolii TaxID=908250 RepID=A0A917FU71_9NOCA|nr:hypothetical protein [Rhodococcus trifolii]GGG01606.1 hypothetical protein GCM10007304_14510 [Rhodococcus trifolii]
MTKFAKFYGANPLHLLAMIFCFVLGLAVVYTAGPMTFWNTDIWWQSIAVWFVGAAVAHDLVLFPLYAVADLSLRSGLDAMRGRRRSRPPLVPVLNYIRVPVLATGLTFLMFFPGIIEQGKEAYVAATGLTQEPYLLRWIVLVAVMFASSAVLYAIRCAIVQKRGSSPVSATER